jgi:Rhodopirellula transposase DDE domain
VVICIVMAVFIAPKQNKAYINIGTSSETAEFVCDSIKNWWITHGAAIESAKTKTGLTVVTDILKKTYEKAKEVAKDYYDHLKITVGDSLPKLNYTISPINSA